ncbi:MAG: hypothetical protein IJC74_01410 [Clostridia bacterium]|nr:hypothetical protein [Clostridia bacterium]
MKELLKNELENYYISFDNQNAELCEKIDSEIRKNSGLSSYELKSCIHEVLCSEGNVKIFENTPLFFEFSSGRIRYDWGGIESQTSTRLKLSHYDEWHKLYTDELKNDVESGLFYGWSPVGYDHLCLGYDKILKMGISGIISEAEAKLKAESNEKKKSFYRSVIKSLNALIKLQHRFEKEAARLAEISCDETKKAHYLKIASAAKRCPEQPPQSFYEALNTIAFCRECISSLEGIGISTWGHLDRLLFPYYINDIKSGVISKEDAASLIADLITYTEIRFDTKKYTYHETSTTIELGGCDENGELVYNELTDIILDTVIDLKAIGTKINCRISKKSSDKFIEHIAKVQLANLPCVMMHNDDVIVASRVKMGQKIEDARLYLGGGCHEVVLANTEVCTRADSWINVPGILLRVMENNRNCKNYDEFYREFISGVREYHNYISEIKNKYEKLWWKFDPMPLYSSTVTGPIEKGLDITEGGAVYNSTMLSMVGAATVADSLYAIKKLVFEDEKISISEFLDILNNNFNGNEELRRYIVEKLPKHGTNNDIMNEFSGKLFDDLSKVSEKLNGRGGKYMPAFYPHEFYWNLGVKTGATPDGRAANTSLSRGVSPSEFVKTDSPLDVINSLKAIDFTKYADSFIAEITLPVIENNEKNIAVFVSLVKGFLEAEGSSIQFNIVDKNLLIEAKNNPLKELYQNLYVRVCGYSAQFVGLSEDSKNHIIQRAVR